jgi:parallel beta-helix repeat protein
VNQLSTYLHPFLRVGKIIVILLALLAVLLVPHSAFAQVPFNPGIGKGSAAECTQTISSGSIENAANALGNGQLLCVRGGLYTEGDKRLNLDTSGTSSAPKKIKAYPGERVKLRGSIVGTGSHWIIKGLFVNASYSQVQTTPGKDGPRTNTDQAIRWSEGTNLRFVSMEVVNRRRNGDPDLAGSCTYFGASGKVTNITIKKSSIHRCGQLPRTNHEHCVYLGHLSGIKLRDNWIYDCADRSMKLDPDTDNALVIGNLVDSDHENGINLNKSADDNTVRNNVVNTPDRTIYTGRSYSGSGNVVINNCVWDTASDLAGDVTRRGNILANPRISGHTVTRGRCAQKLPAGSPFRP